MSAVLRAMLLLLTATAGLVDAVSFLGLGHVFTANMTGNVVFLALAIAGAPDVPWAAPLAALAAFLVGALAGGRIAPGVRRESSSPALELALCGEAALLIVAALMSMRVVTDPGRIAIVAVIAVAMGLRGAVVRKLAVPGLSTLVLTFTLVGLAAGHAGAGHDGASRITALEAIGSMIAGAAAGALLLRASTATPLFVSAIIAASCAAALAAARCIKVPSRTASGIPPRKTRGDSQ